MSISKGNEYKVSIYKGNVLVGTCSSFNELKVKKLVDELIANGYIVRIEERVQMVGFR